MQALNPAQLKVLTNREGQKRHQYTSEKSNTGRYWYFDNGQYGEKTACTERTVISLSYQPNNSYCQIWIFRHYLSDSGSAYGSCMLPISELRPNEKEIADLLHQLDKQEGFI